MGGLKLPAVASTISWPSHAGEKKAHRPPCRSWSGQPAAVQRWQSPTAASAASNHTDTCTSRVHQMICSVLKGSWPQCLRGFVSAKRLLQWRVLKGQQADEHCYLVLLQIVSWHLQVPAVHCRQAHCGPVCAGYSTDCHLQQACKAAGKCCSCPIGAADAPCCTFLSLLLLFIMDGSALHVAPH